MLFLPNAGSERGEKIFPQPAVRKSQRPLVGDDLNYALRFQGRNYTKSLQGWSSEEG